jgi:CelD/BcsL family acetyltransferase involved in cellulose biosynthesis
MPRTKLIDVSVRRPEELSDAELATWERLQSSNPALDSAFLSARFACTVGRFRSDTRVAILRQQGEPVAYLAYQLRPLGVARALALGISDAHAVICGPGFSFDPVALLRSAGISVWDFDHLVDNLDVFSPYAYYNTNASVMDVSGGYEAYMQQDDRAGHRLMRSTMQKRRKLEREQGKLEFVFESSDRDALAALINWKAAQYQRQGRFDRFSRPWVAGVVKALARSDDPNCRGSLSTLTAGGRLVAAHMGIRTASRLSLWFPAYDPDLGQYSPGTQLFLFMAEGAASQGVRLLDLGVGDETFKQSLASWYYPVSCGQVQTKPFFGWAHHLTRHTLRKVDDILGDHPRLRGHLPSSWSGADRVQ